MKLSNHISLWWHRLWGRNPFLWIRCHTFTKYHLVDCRNDSAGYRYGWIDKPELLLYANMAILVDFVEKEKGLEVVDWDFDDKHKEIAKQIREIYEWWKAGRKQEIDSLAAKRHQWWEKQKILPVLHDEIMEGMFISKVDCHTPEYIANREESDKLWKEQEAIEKKEEVMLHLLIDLRGYLWT